MAIQNSFAIFNIQMTSLKNANFIICFPFNVINIKLHIWEKRKWNFEYYVPVNNQSCNDRRKLLISCKTLNMNCSPNNMHTVALKHHTLSFQHTHTLLVLNTSNNIQMLHGLTVQINAICPIVIVTFLPSKIYIKFGKEKKTNCLFVYLILKL